MLLFNYPKSPFYKEFISSGISSGFCSGNGFDGDSYFPVFIIGLKNVI